MMQFILLSLSYVTIVYGAFSLNTCSTFYTNLTECKLSGYCEVNTAGTACQTMTECYRASEVQACLSGSVIIAGCTPINIDFKYENVCKLTAWTTIPNGLLRFRRQTNITRSPDITLSETPISVLSTTTTPQKYTYQLFTLDILLATSTQLTDIINAFKHGINQLITDAIQPKFLEKAVIETFQNIRDDLTYTTLALRSAQLVNAWSLVDILFQRYQNYKAYYTQNYDFINFGFSNLNRGKISMVTARYTIDIVWNSYANNGFIYVMAFAPEQFGFESTGQVSDLIWIKVVKTDNTAQTLTDVPITIQYTWTNTALQSTIFYSTFDKTFPATYLPASSGIALTGCFFPLTATTYCPALNLPAAALDNFILFHHVSPISCSATAVYKRLGFC